MRGFNNVFAVGDVSVNPDDALPQLATPAIQGGKHVGEVIKATVEGKPEPKPFKYLDKGTMATIGRASAIAQIKGLPRLKGFPAWIIWVGLHIQQLMSNRNRFSAMTNLAVKYIMSRSHSAIVGETPLIASRRARVIDSYPSNSSSATSAE